MDLPSFIYLYDGARTESLNLNEISQYLKNIFKINKIQIRDDFIIHYLSKLSSSSREKEKMTITSFGGIVIPAKAGIQPVLSKTGSPIKTFGDDKLIAED